MSTKFSCNYKFSLHIRLNYDHNSLLRSLPPLTVNYFEKASWTKITNYLKLWLKLKLPMKYGLTQRQIRFKWIRRTHQQLWKLSSNLGIYPEEKVSNVTKNTCDPNMDWLRGKVGSSGYEEHINSFENCHQIWAHNLKKKRQNLITRTLVIQPHNVDVLQNYL